MEKTEKLIKIRYFIKNERENNFYECQFLNKTGIANLEYEKLLEILEKDGNSKDSIYWIKYRFNENEPWLKIEKSIKIPSNPLILLQIHASNSDLLNRIEILEKSCSELQSKFRILESEISFIKSHNSDITSNKVFLQDEPQKLQNDIAFLYSLPLVSYCEQKKNYISQNNPIDAYNEISSLQKELEKIHKKISFSVNVASLDRMMLTVNSRPKIMHISCHGAYEKVYDPIKNKLTEELKLYLLLEDNKMQGIMAKCSEKDIEDWFTPKNKNGEIRPRLVFVSACYSQKFGEIIHKSGVPNVVAVNGKTEISDEQATNFSKNFYSLLLRGASVNDAFEKSKNQLKRIIENEKFRLCCCAHKHKPDCQWLNSYTNSGEAHANHLVTCNCSGGGNSHRKNCSWLSKQPEYMKMIEDENDKTRVRVCCCSPELAHSEEEKFVLISQSPEAANEILFENLQDGEMIIDKCYSDEIIPKLSEQICGRNFQLQKLVSILSSENNQIILVVGMQTEEIRLFIRTAAKYLIERAGDPKSTSNNFAHGFSSIQLNNTLCLLSKLSEALFIQNSNNSDEEEPISPNKNHLKAKTIVEFKQKIKPIRKLISLECENMAEGSLLELTKTLREILGEGAKVKFIISVNKEPKIYRADEMLKLDGNIENLAIFYHVQSMINGIKKINYKDFQEIFANKIYSMRSIRALIKEIKVKPSAPLEYYLKNLLEHEYISEICNSAGGLCCMNFSEKVKNEFNIITNEINEIEPIFLLAQLRNGSTESNLIEFYIKCASEDFKSKLDNYIDKNADENKFIKRVYKEEIKENIYFCDNELCNYILSEIITSSEMKAIYKYQCISKISIIIRRILKSYGFKRYRNIRFTEFSAFLSDGIWGLENQDFEDMNSPNANLYNPLERFLYEKDNISQLLEKNNLDEIIPELGNNELIELLGNIKEISICYIAILTNLQKFNESLEFIDTMLKFAEKKMLGRLKNPEKNIMKKYIELEAIIRLIKSSMILNSGNLATELEKNESIKEAENSQKLFAEINNSCGIGEAKFLHGILYSQQQFLENDTLILDIFENAKEDFKKADYKAGIARINIAESNFILNISTKKDYTNIEQLLETAIKICKPIYFLHNMAAECYYLKAIYYENIKQYDLAKNDLQEALVLFEKIANSQYADNCNIFHRKLAAILQKQRNLIGFLKAYPIAHFRHFSLYFI